MTYGARAMSRQGLPLTRTNMVRKLVGIGTFTCLALLLSGCLSSGFTFVSRTNPDKTQLFFKVPSQWKLFGPTQLIEANNGPLSRAQINQIENGEWLTAFSAAPHATAKQQSAPYGARYPAGISIGRQLSVTERDGFSFASLRAVLLGTDPLSGSSQYNVLSYSEFSKPGGLRGSKMEVDITSSNQVVTTFAQVAMVDANTNWVYAIGLGCHASCYGPNQGLFNQILNSWAVKAK